MIYFQSSETPSEDRTGDISGLIDEIVLNITMVGALKRILAQEPEESHIFLGFDSYAENANKKKSALKWINGMDQLNSKKKT